MILAYVLKLSVRVYHTNVGIQKIDDSILEIFGMVSASFQVENKLEKVRFFQETFLLADIIIKMFLDMLFLIFSNTNISYIEKQLIWRSYTIAKALPNTKQVKLINKKKLAKVALDENSETFVIYVASLNLAPEIHLDKQAQIAFLLIEEVRISNKYSNFADIFFEKKTLVLPECTELNQHAINLENNKQPSYRPIYIFGLVEIKILKTYIETHLKTGFI